MIQATDFLSGVQPKYKRVKPSVTIKSINRDFLDALAGERQTDRSGVIDSILDTARAQWEQLRATDSPTQPLRAARPGPSKPRGPNGLGHLSRGHGPAPRRLTGVGFYKSGE